MEQLLNIVVNLSATQVSGRYTLKESKIDIIRSTPKTIITKATFGEVRFQKSELLKVKSDFKNDQLCRLQFYIICYENQRVEAIKIVTDHLEQHINLLCLQNEKACAAFLEGYIHS